MTSRACSHCLHHLFENILRHRLRDMPYGSDRIPLGKIYNPGNSLEPYGGTCFHPGRMQKRWFSQIKIAVIHFKLTYGKKL